MSFCPSSFLPGVGNPVSPTLPQICLLNHEKCLRPGLGKIGCYWTRPKAATFYPFFLGSTHIISSLWVEIAFSSPLSPFLALTLLWSTLVPCVAAAAASFQSSAAPGLPDSPQSPCRLLVCTVTMTVTNLSVTLSSLGPPLLTPAQTCLLHFFMLPAAP